MSSCETQRTIKPAPHRTLPPTPLSLQPHRAPPVAEGAAPPEAEAPEEPPPPDDDDDEDPEAGSHPSASVPTQHVMSYSVHDPPSLASLSAGYVYALPSHGAKKGVAAFLLQSARLVGFWHAPRSACSTSPSLPHDDDCQRSSVHPDSTLSLPRSRSVLHRQMAETV